MILKFRIKKILWQKNILINDFNRNLFYSHVEFSSVAQSCPNLCIPMDRSTPVLPVHHQLPEFTQTHVHRVRATFQPSHPLSSPSPLGPNPSEHRGPFRRVNSSHDRFSQIIIYIELVCEHRMSE